MGSKPKVCKCGHDKQLHKKHADSKWSETTFCRECPCSSYLNRKRPDKSDYGLMVFTVICAAVITILLSVILIEIDPKVIGNENDIVTFTVGELYEITTIVFIGIGFFVIIWFVVDPILEIMQAKKRPQYPIKDENAKL